MHRLAALSGVFGLATAWSPWRPHGGDWNNGDWQHGGSWNHGDWNHGDSQLTVSTTSGHVHGKVDSDLPNVRQFLGIPYAQPPVGDLRWNAPQALSQPDAKIEATTLPPSCNQFLTSNGASLYISDVLQFNLQGLNQTGPTSEDCLTTSIWTPVNKQQGYGWWKGGKKQDALPVLIFIYGGSYTTGGQDVPYQIPAQWVNRTPDHIVVSFNYRLNAFGFPGAKGLKDQNLGFLDQRLAVEWVRDNIASFGGDPSRMVIWGQSAGAGSIDFYNYAYYEDPIVTGLIMDSGTALLPLQGDTTGVSFSYLASQVGCSGLVNETEAQLACMRQVPADKIESFIANHADSGASPSLSFGPIPDDKSVFANYTERALQGKLAKIPAIIGTNLDDGNAFVPYSANGPNAAAAFTALLNAFFCPATETIRLRQQTDRLTYSYRYSGNFSNISPRPWMGAYHSSELPLLHGTHPNYRGPSTQLEYETSHAMQDAWVAFASDPVNGLSSQHWQAYSQLGAKEIREFGAGVAAQDVSLAGDEAQCNGQFVASSS